jgi:LSD1 subclass zinc finger protein
VRKFTGTKPEASMPMRDQTYDLRAQIVEHACGWTDALVEARGLSWRDHYGTAEGRVRRAVKPLVDFMPWAVTEWGAVGDLATETWELDRSIISVLDPTPGEKPVRIGICPALTPEGKCGATLMHTPGAKALTCRWCNTVYPPVTWLQLKTWMDEDKKEVAVA